MDVFFKEALLFISINYTIRFICVPRQFLLPQYDPGKPKGWTPMVSVIKVFLTVSDLLTLLDKPIPYDIAQLSVSCSSLQTQLIVTSVSSKLIPSFHLS